MHSYKFVFLKVLAMQITLKSFAHCCTHRNARICPRNMPSAMHFVGVQVGSSARGLSLGAASARRFLQATFSAKFGAASPDALDNQAPSPLQTPNQTQVPDQAAWPSGPGLWPLGNKSRSGNNTSGDLLYSTDQQPPAWSAPAPMSATSPPSTAVSCPSAYGATSHRCLFTGLHPT